MQFDRGSADRPALVQTYDAGVTVDHWATVLPLERHGALLRNVFEDCAHWWALARHSLIALDAIHELRLVHLDLKPDNICIPAGPADFDPLVGERALHPRFEELTLIDFAFSLVSGERLERALPIAEQADYEYQSPRLLRALEAGRHGDLAPTRQLDWRCDLYSLAAMLWRYLPELEDSSGRAWTRARHAGARSLVRRLIEFPRRGAADVAPACRADRAGFRDAGPGGSGPFAAARLDARHRRRRRGVCRTDTGDPHRAAAAGRRKQARSGDRAAGRAHVAPFRARTDARRSRRHPCALRHGTPNGAARSRARAGPPPV